MDRGILNSRWSLLIPLFITFATMGVILAYTYLVYIPSPWSLTVTVSNGEMHPHELVVSKGAKVFLTIVAEGEDHELSVPGFGINVSIPRGTKTVLDFSADHLGVYPVRALTPISRQAGTITVVEPGFGSAEHGH